MRRFNRCTLDLHWAYTVKETCAERADLGLSEPTIGILVGHKAHSITSRYMHFADPPLLAAADRIANEIETLMLQAPSS